jgi:hypothetical protein
MKTIAAIVLLSCCGMERFIDIPGHPQVMQWEAIVDRCCQPLSVA